MDNEKIVQGQSTVLKFLNVDNLTIAEKIAILRSAASTLESVLATEALVASIGNILQE